LTFYKQIIWGAYTIQESNMATSRYKEGCPDSNNLSKKSQKHEPMRWQNSAEKYPTTATAFCKYC